MDRLQPSVQLCVSSRPKPPKRRWFVSSIALFCTLGMLGCASPGQEQVSQTYQDLDFSLLESEAQTTADCIEAETGFIVDVYRDGSIGYSSQAVPASQQDVYDAAYETCAATVPQPGNFQVKRYRGVISRV